MSWVREFEPCTVRFRLNKFEHIWGVGGGGSALYRGGAGALERWAAGPPMNRRTQLKPLPSMQPKNLDMYWRKFAPYIQVTLPQLRWWVGGVMDIHDTLQKT